MVDIEIDEVFVVVAGEASVTLLDDGRPVRVIQLRPGVVCRLEAGMATLWNVPRVLRKVYFLSASAGSI